MRKIILSKQCKKKFKTSILILLILPFQACSLWIICEKRTYVYLHFKLMYTKLKCFILLKFLSQLKNLTNTDNYVMKSYFKTQKITRMNISKQNSNYVKNSIFIIKKITQQYHFFLNLLYYMMPIFFSTCSL